MLISFERLRYLKLIVELGSISAAARQLGKSASGVTQVMEAFEADLGIALFERQPGKAVRLTSSGKSFYLQAMELIPQLETLEKKAAALQAGVEDELNLALHGFSYFAFINDALRMLQQQYPSVTINLLDIENPASLAKADIRLSLMPVEQHRGMRSVTLFSLMWQLVAAPHHPLARKKGQLSRADLGQYAQLMPLPSEFFDQKLLLSMLYSSSVIQCERFYHYQSGLLDGLGYGIFPSVMSQPLTEEGRLVNLQTDVAVNKSGWPVDLAWSESIGPAGDFLVECLQEQAERFCGGRAVL
ncbi:DNA-binding transcriptional regulator, LysR family [Microbulbifer donghaiensis]|uniref:DNA-binding transcriptional regulator, LysR family n=1 Tax=Microbulbifer donghaiensis TaxID=494016 RepID=A0A1M5GWE3_9GAMM|nr:LysR family transcriptional regulator [Microbulbifer donghaiensis]SHG08043.1 DNA-binding transcriptional regulator, LysR family [Microbulbifer donghaiensis]